MYLSFAGLVTWSVVTTVVQWRYYVDIYSLSMPVFLLLLR